jgi:hypothetical protein
MGIETREKQCVAINGFDARGAFVGHASRVRRRWSVYEGGIFRRYKTRGEAEGRLRSMGAVEIREAAWF